MPGRKIILASRSKARVEMLKKAGLEFDSVPADIDETVQGSAKETALELAKQKALHVSKQHKDALVIGSDQTLSCEDKILSKAENKNDAAEKLKFLRGKTHTLYSGVAVAQNDNIVWSDSDEARLTMKNFDDEFLLSYLDKAGDVLTSCVGAYAIEEHGAELFEKVEGDHFTILGMPLSKLLSYLQEQGAHP